MRGSRGSCGLRSVEFGGGLGLLVVGSGYRGFVCGCGLGVRVGCEEGTCEGCGRTGGEDCVGHATCLRVGV